MRSTQTLFKAAPEQTYTMHRRVGAGVVGETPDEVVEEVVERRGTEDERSILLSPTSTMTVDTNKVSASEEEDRKQAFEDKELGKMEKETGVAGCCGPVSSIKEAIAKVVICAVAGIIFGLALEKARVFEPEAIRRQMVFRQWTMFKMFFAAMGSGQFLLALLSVIPRLRPTFSAATLSYFVSQDGMGVLRALIGPFVLGAGMAVSGGCPGMVLAQVGSNTRNAIFTLIGALGGALLFGLVGDFFVKFITPKESYKYHTIQDKTGIYYAWIAFPMSLCILAGAVLLEMFIPWEADLPAGSRNPVNASSNIILLKAWPPTATGTVVGCLQVVIAFTVKDTIGGSSAYMTIMSQLLILKKLRDFWPRLAKFRCGIGNWWQVFFVGFAILGAFLSSLASQSTSSTPGATIPTAVIGGFLMLIGARTGSGCTSGHGLSGTALLFWWSLLAVPAMFAGGIATAFGMQGFGVLDHYICMDGSVCTGNN